MDQSELRKIENRCIQEQPPACVTACPLHVDVRTFIRHMSEEKWDLAWKVLHKTLPLPGILGRICDAPCQSRCKRTEAGGAIEIGALERFCVSQPPPRRFLPPLPSRNQKVAVVGTGLSGLTAAWDLLRKGYGVHLFEGETPVSYLLNLYPDFLTHDIITGELAILEKLGAVHHSGAEINSRAFIEKCRHDFDALFLCLEGVDAASWGLDVNENGLPEVSCPLQTHQYGRMFCRRADALICTPGRRRSMGGHLHGPSSSKCVHDRWQGKRRVIRNGFVHQPFGHHPPTSHAFFRAGRVLFGRRSAYRGLPVYSM